MIAEGDIQVTDSLVVNLTKAGGFAEDGIVSLYSGQNIEVGDDLTLSVDNTDQVLLANGGNIAVSSGGDTTIGGALDLSILNNGGGQIGVGGNIYVTIGGDFTAASVNALINNRDGGSIDAGGNILFSSNALTTTGDFSLIVSTRDDGGGGGTIGSDSLINLDLASASIGGLLTVGRGMASPGSLGGALSVINVAGDLTASGGIDFNTQNGGLNPNEVVTNGGAIDTDVLLSLTAGSLTSGDFLSALIVNLNGGSIGDTAAIGFGVSGDITVATDAFWQIINTSSFGLPASAIGSDASLVVSAANLTAGSLFSQINNTGGSQIGDNAILAFTMTGAIASAGDATFRIVNFDNGAGNGGGSIGGDATVSIAAQSLSAATLLVRINNLGGIIDGNATDLVVAAGDVSIGADTFFDIINTDGVIGGDATLSVTANNLSSSGGFLAANILNDGGQILGNASTELSIATISSPGFSQFLFRNVNGFADGASISLQSSGSITTGDFFETTIFNNPGQIGAGGASVAVDVGILTVGGTGFFTIESAGGQIDSDAAVSLVASGNLSTGGDIVFGVTNTGGAIGGSATIDWSAPGIFNDGTLFVNIFNQDGGSIGENAVIDVAASGDITSASDAFFQILNDDIGSGGGTIGSDATISLSAASFSAASLFVQIHNLGGTIGGSANITSIVTGAATVSGDATLEILGSDGAASAAINVTGGNYDAGGTFLALTDGDGAITFDNAIVHADVLKVGALGSNGTLTIGGGSLSADTTLRLYAPGSNGEINFVSNVTLGGNSAKIIAAETVTIFDNVVVTIGGEIPADVYTGFIDGEVPIPKANYTGFGGNGSTSGTFAGAGANDPQPIENAPPFDDPQEGPATLTAGNTSPGGKTPVAGRRGGQRGPAINVGNSGELLALLDGAAAGPDGTVTLSSASSPGKNPTGLNSSGRLAPARNLSDRRAPTSLGGGRPLP